MRIEKISVDTFRIGKVEADALVIPVFKSEKPNTRFFKQLDLLSSGMVNRLFEAEEITGNVGETLYLLAPIHVCTEVISYDQGIPLYLSRYEGKRLMRWIFVGVGEQASYDFTTPGMAAATALRLIVKHRISSCCVLVRDPDGRLEKDKVVRLIAEAVEMAPVDHDKYKKKEEKFIPTAVYIHLVESYLDDLAASTAIERGKIVAEAVNFARELCVEPGSTLNPVEFSRRVQAMAVENGLEFECYGEEQLKEMKMEALLAVARGSEQPAQLMVIRYKGTEDSVAPVAIVGKGVTFDSGGLCIKPRDAMWEMKMDMAGAATVAGTMLAVAKLRPKINVLGIIPAVENLPSGSSYKPGDVLRAASGKTIEVIDTDAEGRLILADAIHYANKYKPCCIIDLATLTGACVVALGTLRAALYSNDDDLKREILEASKRAGEKMWPMPLDEDYSEMIKSDIADIKNLGGRGAGSITAAAFLKEFVDTTPWVHLDIAGTAWLEEHRPEMAKGPTGYGVKTLVEFLLSRSAS
ncbi:MAG: leucyl aminopeptidase [Acidobacteriota bacterium]|nr:leucyl aminopeptidase [Blastocatellia bacterium]MDW8412898.1 leucyl aminopeptidase [Acidobacteriota bacterium]